MILLVIFLGIAGVFVALALLFQWGALWRTNQKQKIHLYDASLTNEELGEHAKRKAIEHRITKNKNLLNWPLPRLNSNYNYICTVFTSLQKDVEDNIDVPPAAEWLLDNFYIIEEQVETLRKEIVKQEYLRLPVLSTGPLKGTARIFAITSEFLPHVYGRIQEDILCEYIDKYQQQTVLFEREIAVLPIALRLALVEKIRRQCEDIQEKQMVWKKAKKAVDTYISFEMPPNHYFSKLLNDTTRADYQADPAMVERLLYGLRRSGQGHIAAAQDIEEFLLRSGGTTMDTTQKEYDSQAMASLAMGNSVRNLQEVASYNWQDMLEKLSFTHAILLNDPDGTYPMMDGNTRSWYRQQTVNLATANRCSELHVARQAVLLAEQACGDTGISSKNTSQQRACHVGYYLIDDGLSALRLKTTSDNQNKEHKNYFGTSKRLRLYLFSIGFATLLFALSAALYSTTGLKQYSFLAFLITGVLLLIPASEIAIQITNRVVHRVIKPVRLPRMEFAKGIPEKDSTIVAVPAIIPSKAAAKKLLTSLEQHYLRNREEHLSFAIIGAFQDADQKHLQSDNNIVNETMDGIQKLNARYAVNGGDKFYFFHRERQYNATNNKWIGWERKRGALLEFNQLVLGDRHTSFLYSSAASPAFKHVKYIITLDTDTILPIGGARKMVGVMSHILNRPVIDETKRIVVKGFGIMQPRVEVDIESAHQTLFSKINTSPEGIDPYSGAVSDVYQDMFGEGIFVGKGIYDLKVFQEVLGNTFPENAILSHDLLEGSFLRTGLATDLTLVDTFPSKYSAYTARLHRWTRGDWQLLPFLFSRIQNGAGSTILNPISPLAKWQIFENLRRSMLAPCLMLIALLSVTVLPGSLAFWLASIALPATFSHLLSGITYLFSFFKRLGKTKRYLPVMSSLKSTLWQAGLSLVFLPFQAWLMIHAVIITLVRLFVTKDNMLEWTTADEGDRTSAASLTSYLYLMKSALWQAVTVVVLAVIAKPLYGWLIFPVAILWLCSPAIAFGVSRPDLIAQPPVIEKDRTELRRIARKTWRFFEEFSNAKTHFLAPDNFQEMPMKGPARRTSPTNIGLGLMSTLAARDFGYIGTLEMAEILNASMNSIESLPKWNGHLYNWYDTRTLRPLPPAYISTVDSGNFVGYLMVLKQGLTDYLKRPVADVLFMGGLQDTIACMRKEEQPPYQKMLDFFVQSSSNADEEMNLPLYSKAVQQLVDSLESIQTKGKPWAAKLHKMAIYRRDEIQECFPYLLLDEPVPEEVVQLARNNPNSTEAQLLHLLAENPPIECLLKLYCEAASYIGILLEDSTRTGIVMVNKHRWLLEMKNALQKAKDAMENRVKMYIQLIDRVDALVQQTRFLALYNQRKRLFTIGYNIDEDKMSSSSYDLLASEARQASYIGVSSGEIPPEHWERMGRALTIVDRYKGLVSWTGTMFEYLMPLLITKSYKNTLLDETYSFVIKSQIKYGNMRGIPWGNSESAYYAFDKSNDYQYKAIGVPWLGLKRGLAADAVVAPYATVLALMVAPDKAIKNMRYLQQEGLEGPYGFREAADYTPERLFFDTRCSIVKSYMAHHQGMSLLAINNYLHQNIMQTRFHANPSIEAYRFLLQEKVPANMLITKKVKEKVSSAPRPFGDRLPQTSTVSTPDFLLPKVHILSNGTTTVLLTDKGTGYTKNKTAAVSRWREDTTLDSYGMFFYLRNVETNCTWSAAYAPMNQIPDFYEVAFSEDKVVYNRTDGFIQTKTEVSVATGDNAEVRRVSVKNSGKENCTLELTSYFEPVLTLQEDDEAHPAFSNLFVETSFLESSHCVVANRRSRHVGEKGLWLGHLAVLDGYADQYVTYETDRMKFLGRGCTAKMPQGLNSGRPLSGTTGPVLDPSISLRVRLNIPSGKTAVVSFVTLVSESEELLLTSLERYQNPQDIKNVFYLAFTREKTAAKHQNFKPQDVVLYQQMLSHILYISPIKRWILKEEKVNRMAQPELWRYGVSGDKPIVLLTLTKDDNINILMRLLKAHEYWRLMDISVDFVILTKQEYSYSNPLYNTVKEIVGVNRQTSVIHNTEDVFIFDAASISDETILLLKSAARIVLEGDAGAIETQIEKKCVEQYPAARPLTKRPVHYTTPQLEKQTLSYFNGLGGFITEGNAYILYLENGQNTPAPWINVIANPDFGFTVSESGSGYTWYKNSHEYRLTPWSNDAVCDSPGEMIYISDTETGEIWTPTPLPIREKEAYEIQHGFGYSTFSHQSHGISQTLTQHVPQEAAVKVSRLVLHNNSEETRQLSITYYITPVLGTSPQKNALHIISSQTQNGTLLINNPYHETFSKTLCFMGCSEDTQTVTGNRQEFFGAGGIEKPASLSRTGLSGNVGAGYEPCGAIQVQITLLPDEKKEIVFVLGAAETAKAADEIVALFASEKKACVSQLQAADFWEDMLGTVQISTPNQSMNLLMNGWLQYQVVSCRLWARTGFYQSGGAFGFRDQLQDTLSLAATQPEFTRKQILLHAAHQFEQGDVQHWWHEPENKGVRTRFSDDRLWLVYVTLEYIKVSGDDQILHEQIPFLNEEELHVAEDERYGTPATGSTASLYEHLTRAVDISLSFGENGLALMGSGDWNDGMNTVGNEGKGESVWLSWFLITILEMIPPVCHLVEDVERALYYHDVREQLIKAVEETAWDGNWYRRAYFDDGTPLGSAQNKDCKIDSIAQSWAVISGAAKESRTLQAMNSLEYYLVSKEDGLIKLLVPPFDEGDSEPGYIKGYLPGVRENGGQYTHAAVWAIIAFAKMGDGNKAMELFDLISPIHHTDSFREYMKYKVEPYVMAADVYAVPPHAGRGGWSWYTGAASWMIQAGLVHILGFVKSGSTLTLNPHIPEHWEEYNITYRYLETTYQIHVMNPCGVQKGVEKVILDGILIGDGCVQLLNDEKEHLLTVYMG